MKPSEVQQLHHFKHPLFLRYAEGDTKDQNLLQTYNELSRHDHPIAAIAGGWAMAERSIRRPSSRLPFRSQNLDSAQRVWTDQLPRLVERTAAASDPRAQADLLDHTLYTAISLASLPSFRLVVQAFAGEAQPSQFSEYIAKTRLGLLAVGRDVLAIEPRNDYEKTIRMRTISSIVASLLMQDAQPVERVFLPGPVSARYKPRTSRADLISVRLMEPYAITRVILTNHTGSTQSYRVSPQDNLCLEPGSLPEQTLAVLLHHDGGTTLPAETAYRLTNMSRALITGLRSHHVEANAFRRYTSEQGS